MRKQMIIKKRKRNGNRKSVTKKSKKPHRKSISFLDSLPTTSHISDEDNEKNVTPSITNKQESKKILQLIVYINEFDRLDEDGTQKCRNKGCENFVCKPFRRYCSKKCSVEFTRWYNKNFY